MITCFRTQKSFSLGIEEHLRDEWAFRMGKWRRMKPSFRDEEWFCEDYEYGVAETKDMLECWLNYLPGVKEWDDYGDFSITFDMDEVLEAGWCEQFLIEMLGDMVTYIKMRRVIRAEEPWLYTTKDAYGNEVRYHRHPAIEVLSGMLDKDYPSELTPTG